MLKTEMIGRLGDDATVQESGKNKIINFSVAHTQRKTDANGEKTETTTWVSCSRFLPKTSDSNLAEYLKKGTAVFVRGDLSTNEWEKGGEKRFSLRLRVTELELLSSKQAAAPGGDAAGKATVPTPRPELDETLPDEPLPF